MGREFNQLNLEDRIKIDTLLKEKVSVNEIAKQLEVHRSTVYREIKRGSLDEQAYNPYLADEKYKEHLKVKGAKMKTDNYSNDIPYEDYMGEYIDLKEEVEQWQ